MTEAGLTNLSGLETTPEVGDEKLGPAGAATLIADFVDVLIPGERLWPSARTVGVQGQLALRLMEERGKNALPALVKAIEAAGGPLEGLDEAESEKLLARLWEHATRDELSWTHVWKAGDFLVWDNRCAMHYREEVDDAQRRVMFRTQFAGQAPIAA